MSETTENNKRKHDDSCSGEEGMLHFNYCEFIYLYSETLKLYIPYNGVNRMK